MEDPKSTIDLHPTWSTSSHVHTCSIPYPIGSPRWLSRPVSSQIWDSHGRAREVPRSIRTSLAMAMVFMEKISGSTGVVWRMWYSFSDLSLTYKNVHFASTNRSTAIKRDVNYLNFCVSPINSRLQQQLCSKSINQNSGRTTNLLLTFGDSLCRLSYRITTHTAHSHMYR